MDLLWTLLLVLLCSEAETVLKVKGQLGENATLKCSFNDSNIQWFMEVHSRLRACIGRTYTSQESDYCAPGFETKYLILGSRLRINNLTAEDCRLYFCGRMKAGNIEFVDTIHLCSDDLITPSTITPAGNQQQHDIIMYSSLGLNGVLTVVVIGLICASMSLRRKEHSDLVDDCENLETVQYEEILLPPHRVPPPAPPAHCIYYKAQLPHATLPP